MESRIQMVQGIKLSLFSVLHCPTNRETHWIILTLPWILENKLDPVEEPPT